MIEGWLIYNREDYEKNRPFADRFVEQAEQHGLALSLRFRDELCMGFRSGDAVVLPHLGGGAPAFAINRTRDFQLACCLEQAGCRVFNPSETVRVGNDKIASHLLAANLGLPQVDMAFCENTPQSIAQHGLAYPVVLKSPYGHGGSEVFLCRDEQELLNQACQIRSGKALVQRLCGKPGVDVRVYVLGNRVLRAVKRYSTNDFRANLSLGGSVEYYELNQAEKAMVERVLGSLTLDFAGIDFIMDAEGGLLFNEIEDVVGSRSPYQLDSVDVVSLYLDHIRLVMRA
jgi:gamma-F420-2:alpha-L-glutamate ligase